jgi:hypothetical protein
MIPLERKRGKYAALVLVTVLAAAGTTVAEPQPQPAAAPEYRGAMHDATTPEALQTEMKATASFDSQLLKLKAKPQFEGRPDVQSSLLTSSLFLSDGTHYTIIPVGSILALPNEYRSRVIPQPAGDFTFWPNFLKLNSSWLAAKEVPLEMAKGDGKAGEAVMRSLSLNPSSRVVVSVYRNNPISILEPVAESKEPKSNSAKP